MMMPTRTLLVALAVVFILAAGTAVVLAETSNQSASDANATVITVTGATVRGSLPAGFEGLSMELRGLEAYAGTDPTAINPVFEQLLRNLSPNQQGLLRIGGDGTDWTWWPVPHVAKPGGVRFDLDRNWMDVAKTVAQTVNLRLIMGVNLEANSSRVAGAEARAMLSYVGAGRIEGLEIGNEPELYGSFPWYKAANGTHVRGRAESYDFGDFLREFSTMARAMPGAPLAGPSTGSPVWMQDLPQFLRAEPRVRVAALHRYPLKHCGKEPLVLRIPELLSSSSQAGLAASVARYVGVAHSHHIPLRIDELNAVSCGGQRGVSDTFASALWALDTLFELARVGVDGVNFHTVPRTINELVSSDLAGGQWSSHVHPQYYGMMMFAQAAPAGAQMIRVAGASGSLHVWVTRARDGTTRVTLINDDPRRTRTLAIKLPHSHETATLERLKAPRLGSTSGVTLGGQTFGEKTTTGKLAGTQQIDSVKSNGRSYTVQIGPASAALLTVPSS
jgi:hypothetical protein